MEFSADLSAFRKAFATVAKLAPAKSPNPIRSSVKIRSDDDGCLVLDATDNEVSIRWILDGMTIVEGGQVAVPAAKLSEILGKLDDGRIVFRLEEDRFAVKCGKFKGHLATFDAKLFPGFRGLNLPTSFRVDAADLSRAIARTISVGRTDADSGHRVASLNLTWVADQATLVGFDGGRAVRQMFPIDPVATGMSGILIPVTSLSYLTNLLKSAVGPIEVAVDTYTIVFKFGSIVIGIRLAEGKYKDWGSIPNPEIAHTVRMSASLFFGAADQVSVFVSPESRSIKMILGSENISFSSNEALAGGGFAEVNIPVPGLAAQDYRVAFDYRYLTDALTPLGDEEVEVEFPVNPAPVNFKAFNYEHRVAPIVA